MKEEDWLTSNFYFNFVKPLEKIYINNTADATTKSEAEFISTTMMKMFNLDKKEQNQELTEALLVQRTMKIAMSLKKMKKETENIIKTVKGTNAYQKIKNIVNDEEITRSAQEFKNSYDDFQSKMGDDLKKKVGERGGGWQGRRRITYNDIDCPELDDFLKKGHAHTELTESKGNLLQTKNKALKIKILPQVEETFSQKFSIMNGGGVLDDLEKFDRSTLLDVLDKVKVDENGNLLTKESLFKKGKNLKNMFGSKKKEVQIFKIMKKIESTNPKTINRLKEALTLSWGEVGVMQPELPGIVGEGLKANNPTEIIKGTKSGILKDIEDKSVKKVAKKLLKALGLKRYKHIKTLNKKFNGWVAKHLKLAGSIVVAFEVVGIAMSAYEIAMGVKNLQGSGTITDTLERTAMNIDLATFQALEFYVEISGNDIENIDFEMKKYYMTGLELHTCNKVI